MATANAEGAALSLGLGLEAVAEMEIDEEIKRNKRLNEDMSGEDLSSEEKNIIIQLRRSTAKKTKIAIDKEEENKNLKASKSLFDNLTEPNSANEILTQNTPTKIAKHIKKNDESNETRYQNASYEKRFEQRQRELERGVGVEDDGGGEVVEEGGGGGDGEIEKETAGDNAGYTYIKSKAEKRREQRIRECRDELTAQLMGDGKPQGREDSQSYIINIQNVKTTGVCVEKCASTMIANVISGLFHHRDIVNIQINKQKKWATCKIQVNTQKSKDAIMSLDKADIPFILNEQIKWKISLYKRGSIGIINRVPIGQDEEDIKTCLNGKGIKVETVRKLGPTVFSIKFQGPLPRSVILPCRDYPFIVERYVPGARKCVKCFKYGHHADSCDSPAICGKCRKGGHLASACDSTGKPLCPNCKGEHAPDSLDCPERLKMKNLKKEKISNYRTEREDIQTRALQSIWGIPAAVTTNHEVMVKKPELSPELEIDKMEERIMKKVNTTIEDKMEKMENMIGRLLSRMSDAIMDKVNEAIIQMRIDFQSSMADGSGTVGGQKVRPSKFEDEMFGKIMRGVDLGKKQDTNSKQK